MAQSKHTISPELEEAQAMVAELKKGLRTYQAIYLETDITPNGLRKIRNGDVRTVTSETTASLRAAVSRLRAGQVGPAKSITDVEGEMIDKFNRDAAESGTLRWEELRERDREEIRARWHEVVAAQRRQAAAMEREFFAWAEDLVRERTPTR